MLKKLVVIGLGYVGLPTAVLFANRGFSVLGMDADIAKVEAVNSGKCYIHGSSLADMLLEAVNRGFLRATTDAVEAIRESDAVIIAVPTPARDGIADLTYLRDALETVKKGLHRGLLVVIESTVPPGTITGLAKPLLEDSGLKTEEDFYLAYVPERIAPGRAIEELLSVPRVVGGVGPKSTEKTIELYGKVNSKLLPTDAITAEFVKLIENTYRDLNIAYANLLAFIAEKLGVDVYEAIRLSNTHPRVNVHMPGAGVGGPCLTKDPYMLTLLLPDFWGSDLIRIARRINEYMPKHMVDIIKRALTDARLTITNAKIAVLGAAYKGGTDDTRESPAGHIVRELLSGGARVVVYDPYTNESFGAKRAFTLEEATRDADAIVVVTDHPEFKEIDLNVIGKLVKYKIIIDGRRVIDPHYAIKYGFKYYGVGYGRAFRL
jgi:UDP-N-acetyl-D-mannosaminuronic acid dehydrogenase